MKENVSKLIEYVDRDETPRFILDGFNKLGFKGFHIKGYGSAELTIMDSCIILYEIAKFDTALAIFLLAESILGMATLYLLGSEEQKDRILPLAMKYEKQMAYGLTEPQKGSESIGLDTIAQKVEGGYLITGEKRWIGNGTIADYIIVWAKNVSDENKVQGFIVEKGSQGFTSQKIHGKYSCRLIQNGDLKFDKVFVPEKNKLPKADDFKSVSANSLFYGRLYITFMSLGCAAGAIEPCLNYIKKRKQFNKSIGSFQIIQEKLVRTIANIESTMMMAIKIAQLFEQGKATTGQVTLVKAYASKLAHEAALIGRECMGGNGILIENQAIKMLMDAQTCLTGEGSYEMNHKKLQIIKIQLNNIRQ